MNNVFFGRGDSILNPNFNSQNNVSQNNEIIK